MAELNSSGRKLSNREQRDLDIEIQFLEGVTQRDRRYVEALQLLGDDYTRRGRFEDGLSVDRRLARLCPSDPLVHYNLACSFSLTEEFRKAANDDGHQSGRCHFLNLMRQATARGSWKRKKNDQKPPPQNVKRHTNDTASMSPQAAKGRRTFHGARNFFHFSKAVGR